jgi:hypothetical protein
MTDMDAWQAHERVYALWLELAAEPPEPPANPSLSNEDSLNSERVAASANASEGTSCNASQDRHY